MLFGIRDKETDGVGKCPLGSADFHPRRHLRRTPCPLRVTGHVLRAGGRCNCRSNCDPAAVPRLLFI
jgi:hypothetical protein